jgi:hypothetical protein
MAVMGEVSRQQVLDLLFEVADAMDKLDAKFGEILVEAKILNYEMTLGRQRLNEAASRFSGKVTPQ